MDSLPEPETDYSEVEKWLEKFDNGLNRLEVAFIKSAGEVIGRNTIAANYSFTALFNLPTEDHRFKAFTHLIHDRVAEFVQKNRSLVRKIEEFRQENAARAHENSKEFSLEILDLLREDQQKGARKSSGSGGKRRQQTQKGPISRRFTDEFPRRPG